MAFFTKPVVPITETLPEKEPQKWHSNLWRAQGSFPFDVLWSNPPTNHLDLDQAFARDEQDSIDLEHEDVNDCLLSHRQQHQRKSSCAINAKLLITGFAVIALMAISTAAGIYMGRRLPPPIPQPRPTIEGPHNLAHNSATQPQQQHHHNTTHEDSPPPPDPNAPPKQCGSTPAQARARGCVFEPQLTGWVPQACAFPAVVAEFEAAVGDMMAEWPWYRDAALTQPVVDPDDVAALQAGNYTTIYTPFQASHALHCTYCWRKVAYALEHGVGALDARCHQFYHQRHCAYFVVNALLEAEDWRAAGKVDAEAKLPKWTYPLLYHDCVPIDSTTES